MTVIPLPSRTQQLETVGAVDAASARSAGVVAAVAAQWPALGIGDLGEVLGWATKQVNDLDQSQMINHLLAGAGADVDPRVHLVLRMSQPFSHDPDHKVPEPDEPESRATDGQVSETTQVWCKVPHRLITDATVSDSAVMVWLALGSMPVARREFRSVPSWWVAERVGWDVPSVAAGERRLQRAAVELQEAGWLKVERQPIGGGRSRPAYRVLRTEGVGSWERVHLREVKQLSPSLLRAYLRWLQIMGHHGRTRLSLDALAERWHMSLKQARRHRDALSKMGLLRVAPGVVYDALRPVDNCQGQGTFLSGGRDNFVGLIERHTQEERHAFPLGTNVPPVEDLTREREPRRTEPPVRLAESQEAAAPPTGKSHHQAVPNGNRPVKAQRPDVSTSADTDLSRTAALRIISSVGWLNEAPPQVRHQLRSVLSKELRRLSHGVTEQDLIRACQDADPVSPTDQHCRLVRAAVAGLYADAKAVPNQPCRTTRLAAPPGQLQERTETLDSRDPLARFRTGEVPAEPCWSSVDLDDQLAWDYLITLFARGSASDSSGQRSLLIRVQTRLPERWHDLAAAAAETVTMINRTMPPAQAPPAPTDRKMMS